MVGSARDIQQSELLVRKYFRKGDVYVHSELQGSCIVIIKNLVEVGVIPPGTLTQAGVMTVATSRAWEVKQGTLSICEFSGNVLLDGADGSHVGLVGSVFSGSEGRGGT